MADFEDCIEEANLALFDGDHADALAWLDDADAAAADDVQHARSLELRGCVLIGLHEYEDAVDVLVRATELSEDTEEPSEPGVWGNLGYALDRLNLYEAAEEAHRQCIEMYEAREGPEHPRTLRKLGDLAFSLIGQGKLDEAQALLHRAVDAFDAQTGREPTWHVQAISNLGYFLLRSRRDADAALGCFDRAQTLYAEGAVDTMILDTVLRNRAEAEAVLGRKPTSS